MTQEEKAKAYDEALERAKQFMTKELYAECNGNLVEYIFPELKDEDERIKREILELVSIAGNGNQFDEIKDWLEKQGKETSMFPNIEDDVRRRNTIQVLEYARSLDTYNQYGKADIDKNIAWLEKQGEKQSIWTDNDRVMAFTLLRDVDQMTYISSEGKNARLQWLNSLEEKFNKSLDHDKVIEWLECKAFQGWAEPIDIRPIIRKFKKDFGI